MPPGTGRVLADQSRGNTGAKPKIRIVSMPPEVMISSGGTPATLPLRSPTTSGSWTGVS